MTDLVFDSEMPASAQELYDWHMRPGAFDRLTPPWDDVELESQDRPIANGSRAEIVLRKGPIRKRWIARHEDVRPGESFRDVQEAGPFASWRHHHRFVSGSAPGTAGPTAAPSAADSPPASGTEGTGLSRLVDELSYRLPFEPISAWIAGGYAKSQIERLFRHRHDLTRRDLRRHRAYDSTPLRIAISGGTGLVGSALAAYLSTAGHEIHLLERAGGRSGPPWAGRIEWSVRNGTIEREKLEGMDAVVHLAGAPIAVRWTAGAKEAIVESRVRGTELLAGTVAGLERPPRVFVSASAVGWYGQSIDDRPRTETDPAGEGFLASVTERWEAAADLARAQGIRTVHPRLGVVLAAQGGALAKMLPAFRFGAGGPIGSGRQWFPWISLEDVLGAIEHLIHQGSIDGPVNLTAPESLQQVEFARVLGRVLGRPSFAPLPAAVVRMMFGEMGKETLLTGLAAQPTVLAQSGFEFVHGDLERALRDELGR